MRLDCEHTRVSQFSPHLGGRGWLEWLELGISLSPGRLGSDFAPSRLGSAKIQLTLEPRGFDLQGPLIRGFSHYSST